MERGFEQFFVLAAILLAAVVNLLVRGRRKTREDQPADVAGVEEEVVLVEEPNTELLEQGPVEPQLPPAAAVPLPSPRPSPPTPARPRRRWLKHPSDARRGIILMVILGPCRGLQAPHSEA